MPPCTRSTHKYEGTPRAGVTGWVKTNNSSAPATKPAPALHGNQSHAGVPRENRHHNTAALAHAKNVRDRT